MKKTILLIPLFIFSISFGQINNPDSVYLDPEIPAYFIYGNEELSSFISNNLIVPRAARFYGINGEVELKFTIDSLGGVTDVSLMSEYIDLGKAIEAKEKVSNEDFKGFFSDEGKRVVLLLGGLFEPALNHGHAVNSYQKITLTFHTKQYDDNERDFRVLQGNQNPKDFNWNFGTYTRDDPDYANDRYLYGVNKLQDNKVEIACKYFEEAIRINSGFIDAYFNLGIAYNRINRKADACKMWEKAAQLGDVEAGLLMKEYCKD